jgi:hypothetical protein
MSVSLLADNMIPECRLDKEFRMKIRLNSGPPYMTGLVVALTLSLAATGSAQSIAPTQPAAPLNKWFARGVTDDPSSLTLPFDQPGLRQAGTQNAVSGSQLRLEGTWEISEILSFGSVPSLFTFSAGPDADHGTVIMSDTYMFTANPSCINAQGSWKRIGDASFVGTHKAFCFDANNGFQPDGWQIWRYAVTLSADGNSLLGRSRLNLYDANGNLLSSTLETLQGTRMDAQGPP